MAINIKNRLLNIFKGLGSAVRGNSNELAAVSFAAVLVAFFALNLFAPDKSFSEKENRMLQEFPDVSVHDYLNGRFEKSFEDYANDQFILRDKFIRVKSSFDAAIGGIKSNGVWKGRGGYLIEDSNVPSGSFIKDNSEAIGEFIKANPGIRARFLLAPNAVSIMKKKLPVGANPADQNIYMDSFFEAVKKVGCEPIDVRESFEDAKKDRQLFYYTDHHWTSAGAELAYQAIKESFGLEEEYSFKQYPVKNDFLGTMSSKSGFSGGRCDEITLPVREDDGRLNSVIFYEESKKKTTEFYNLDKLEEKDAYQVFGGTNHSIYTIKTPVKGNRRLLLIKDSYANSVLPYLMQHYTEIVVVDPRYYYDNIQDVIDVEGIKDVLFLYNANTFFEDSSLKMMLEE